MQIPHDVVTEFLGGITFSRNKEKDVMIAEEIASNTYKSMDELAYVCSGLIELPKDRKAFENYLTICKTHESFYKYFQTPNILLHKVSHLIMSHLSDAQEPINEQTRRNKINFVKWLVLNYANMNQEIDADAVYKRFCENHPLWKLH